MVRTIQLITNPEGAQPPLNQALLPTTTVYGCTAPGKENMNHFNFSVLKEKQEKQTPRQLMLQYAQNHSNVRFGYNEYNTPYIEICNVKYLYECCKTIAVSQNSEMITVYLSDNPLVPTPGISNN